MQLSAFAEYLDHLLRVKEIPDSSLNGLQVGNSGDVERVALAVDASQASIQKAQDANCQLLLVHHGLFWGKPVALTGAFYQRIKLLMDADLALYATHLPLDLHPELGNNAQVQQKLNWPVVGDFGEYHGVTIGKKIEFTVPQPLENLVQTFEKGLACDSTLWQFGPPEVKTIGYVSGGALSMLEQAIECGYDLYVTGEPGHSYYWTAKEAGINVLFGGHYATETLGVQAVGQKIEQDLSLETVFIDLPTGL